MLLAELGLKNPQAHRDGFLQADTMDPMTMVTVLLESFTFRKGCMELTDSTLQW